MDIGKWGRGRIGFGREDNEKKSPTKTWRNEEKGKYASVERKSETEKQSGETLMETQ